MNLFNPAFTKLLTRNDDTEFAKVCRIAIRSTLKVKTIPYQCFTITREVATQQNFKPMDVLNNHLSLELKHLRELIQTALEESLSANGIAYTHCQAGISCGASPVPRQYYPSPTLAVIEVFATNGEEIICWNRCIEELREDDTVTKYPKLEWDRTKLPTPEDVGGDTPILLLKETDLALISTGDETLRDFAKEAIDAGWSSVTIRGEHLLLIN